MPRSKQLKFLERETSRLRGHFLPDPFDPLGQYDDTARVQAHTRAFVVLAHAEVESYLESWAKEIARAAERAWIAKRRVTGPLAFLLATRAERLAIPETLAGPGAKDPVVRLREASVKLFEGYFKLIRENNGVKEKNFVALFAPLGIEAGAVSATLLPDLDTFGSLRGKHAHNSARSVESVLDPETEFTRVSKLLIELESLDTWLSDYRRRTR